MMESSSLRFDDNEIANFRKLGDQVFGERQFLFQVTILSNPKGRALDKYVANCHEYLIGTSQIGIAQRRIRHTED